MYPTKNAKYPYERYTGKEPNTVKRLVKNQGNTISGSQDFKLKETDFESGQDSTILVRERVRGSQLEGAYKKRKGTLLSQSEHSITFLPAGKTKATILSNRDEGRYHADDQPCSSKQADEQLAEQQFFAIRNQLPIGNKLPEKHKLPEENELPEENKLPEGNELTEKNELPIRIDWSLCSDVAHSETEIENNKFAAKQPMKNEVEGSKKTKPPMAKLKEKIKRRQKKQKAKKRQKRQAENLETIIEIKSGDKKNMQQTHHKPEVKNEREQHEETTEEELPNPMDEPEMAERTKPEKLPPRKTVQQENLQARRGERQRYKPDFYGNNAMISNIKSPTANNEEPQGSK